MKGVVFTEFLEMVEAEFSPDLADRIIEESELSSGGAYTAVGTYDHQEMIQLVSCLSQHTQIGVPDLLREFGRYLFGRFTETHPAFFQGASGVLDFLARVDDYIHVEVRKLYPDAELPEFVCETAESGKLIMTYRSARPFAALADGLIRGCIAHFDEPFEVEIQDLSDGQGTSARFVLTRVYAAS